MKNIIKIITVLFALNLSAQTTLLHVANAANTNGHISTIESQFTNGKSDAILIVTQNYGAYNSNEIGVWYSAGKWKIFNQNLKPIPNNSKFNILILPANTGKAYIHSTSGTNTTGHITTLESALTNGKPDALVYVTQNYGKYNTSNVGVWYSGGKWKIFNEDTKNNMPVGTKFNVLVLNPGNNKIGNQDLYGFKYTNSSTGHISTINTTKNFSNNAVMFATQNWKNTYNPNVIGVWHDGTKWTTYNQNRVAIPKGVQFNILAVDNNNYKALIIKDYILPVHSVFLNKGTIHTEPIAQPNAGKTDREGPDAKLPVTFSDVPQIDMIKETFNFYDQIYKDQNPDSNIFYYLPKQFTLKWSQETNEYAFNVYYMATEGSSRGSVLLNIEITTNLNSEDVELAEKMISQKLGKKITLRPLDLRSLPKVDFGGLMSRFNIDKESVSASIPSDYQQRIVLDWRMDSNIDNFVGAMLNQKMGAMMNFEPYGDNSPMKSIPINLKVNSFDTFGKIRFDSASALLNGWTNYLDYAIYPTKLTILRKNGINMYFETIALARNLINPSSEFRIGDAQIISELSKSPSILGIWMNYEVDENCDVCNQKVKRKIIGGTSGSEITAMEIQILNALENSGANTIKIYLKSKQADPSGIEEIQLHPIQINEDGQTINEIQFFVPQGEMLSYDYQVLLVMNSGKILKSKWIKGNSNLLVLGENQINDLFPDKKKDDMLDNAKNSAIEKIKDTLLGKGATEKDVVDKAFEVLGNLIKKKPDSTQTKKTDN